MTDTEKPARPADVYCTVLRKRARDLTDHDTAKFGGYWREVLAVYTDQEQLDAEFDLSQPYQAQLRQKANHAFDRISETYVMVRFWLHDKSATEMEDEFVTLYRNDLVEVQSLPAWELARD